MSKEDYIVPTEVRPKHHIYISALIDILYDAEDGLIDASYLESGDVSIRKKQFTATRDYSESILAQLAHEGIIVPFDEVINTSDIDGYTDVLWEFNFSDNHNWSKETFEYFSTPPVIDSESISDITTVWKELLYDDVIRNFKDVYSYHLDIELEMDNKIRDTFWDILNEFNGGQIYWMNWVAVKSNQTHSSVRFTDEFTKGRILETISQLRRKVRSDTIKAKFYDRGNRYPQSKFYNYWLVDVLNIEKEAFQYIPSTRLLSKWLKV